MDVDPLIDRYFRHVEQRHKDAKYVTSMSVLARATGHPVKKCVYSLTLPSGELRVSRNVPKLQQRADIAHELAHALADEKGFTTCFYHEHASVSDIYAHVEDITEHAADLLLMPPHLVSELVDEYGWTARLIWQLCVEANVSVAQAMRRVAYACEGVSRSAFLAFGRYIVHVEGNHFAPFWPGARVPEPHILCENGISLFKMPRKKNTTLGLLTIPPCE